jgi:ketosteroid isomerase-like protein
MSRRLIAPAALLTLVLTPAAWADEARDLAEKATKAGEALFNARDAKGLAATYTEGARLDVISREKDTGVLKVETKAGRAEIESFYENFFKDGNQPHAKNTIEFARTIGDGLLTFTGVFVPDTEAAEPLRLPFVQVREKQGDTWRVVSLQLFLFPEPGK